MALDALPIREVISTSMEPSAEMRYVNEGPNSTSLPSMFIPIDLNPGFDGSTAGSQVGI